MKAYQRASKESQPFYHSGKWKKARRDVLQRDGGMCRDCMSKFDLGIGFKPRRAVTVHHILPLLERPDLALCYSNLISLCQPCHNVRHPEKGRQADISPIKRRQRIIKV